MRRIISTRYRMVILLVGIVLVGLGLAAFQANTATPGTKLSPLPTNGRPAHAGGAAANQRVQPTDSTMPTDSGTTPKTPDDIDAGVAPRQRDLAEQITNQIEYRTLALVNDPLLSGQWYVNHVQAQEAWDTIDEGKSAVVAVIDSGFALEHEDLHNKWQQNESEIGNTESGDGCWDGSSKDKSSNNCDDDGNGYIDDWRGWDFYYVDNAPSAGSVNSEGGGVAHGTQVAGLVGAESNNGVGVASVGYTNTIMPLQVMNDDGSGYTSDIVAAVYYAVDNGAQVINMSLGTAYQDTALRDALRYAEQNNVLVVAAAGNCGVMVNDGICNILPAGSLTYPAKYGSVIAVGATTSAMSRAGFSSYGSELDIVAPGSDTLASTTWAAANQSTSYTSSLYGTSFASPIVASIAGIMKAENPTAPVVNLRAALIANSQKLGSLSTTTYTNLMGHGMVSAVQAQNLARTLRLDATTPELLYSGTVFADSRYASGANVTVGCAGQGDSWCAIWLTNNDGNERYLPFKQLTGTQNWVVPSAVLGGGIWDIRSIGHSRYSPGKLIYQK